jgi:hypothetical protein
MSGSNGYGRGDDGGNDGDGGGDGTSGDAVVGQEVWRNMLEITCITAEPRFLISIELRSSRLQ